QQHQADGIRMMTEAFRRNPDMATIAVHLFIDAWPNGWMKTIMDFKRNPKPAYFAYRDALEPVMLSLRTDRLSYYAGEEIKTELYLCNDTDTSARYDILFELLDSNGIVVRKGSVSGRSKPLTSVYVATPSAVIENVEDREQFTLRAVLKDGQTVITYAEQTVEVFARQADVPEDKDTVWVTGLTKGEYDIAGEHVVVSEMPMGPSYFVSVAEDGPLADAFRPMDFKNWYDEKADRMAPICSLTFRADHFKPFLTGADARWDEWNSTEVKSEAMVLAEKEYMGKRYLISTLDIRTENPVARRLLNVLNEKRKNCGK
ncbi:MAG: hypothetical protein IJR83_02120, partial [Clostridia bacterium]|nr:hypothetical protein [Clostridia bacterium]